MNVKIHRAYREVVAICDSNLLGKKFEEGKFQLDVKESFYKGEELGKHDTILLMRNMAKEDATFNLIGEETIQAGIEAGIIRKEGIKKIQGVPFALILV